MQTHSYFDNAETVTEAALANIKSGKGVRDRSKEQQTVSVHVMKLEDMPEPLSKREVEQICISNGLNLNEGNDQGGLHGR